MFDWLIGTNARPKKEEKSKEYNTDPKLNKVKVESTKLMESKLDVPDFELNDINLPLLVECRTTCKEISLDIVLDSSTGDNKFKCPICDEVIDICSAHSVFVDDRIVPRYYQSNHAIWIGSTDKFNPEQDKYIEQYVAAMKKTYEGYSGLDDFRVTSHKVKRETRQKLPNTTIATNIL